MDYRDLNFSKLGIRTLPLYQKESPGETRARTQPGTVKADRMFVGSGDSVFKADKQGIYLGNSEFDDAPFSVDKDGNAILTSATLTGTVSPTGNFNMEGYDIDDVGKITADSVVGPLTGNVTGNVTGDLTGNADTADSVNGLYIVTEYWLPIIPQWQFSLSTSYVTVDGSLVQVNFSDLDGWDVFLEVTGKTDAQTGYFQLYNVTDVAAFTGSELSTASTDPVILRTSALTKPSGTKSIALQYKIPDGDEATEYVNAITAKLVVRLSA